MDYKKKGDEELDLIKDDSLRVFKRYNHWSYVRVSFLQMDLLLTLLASQAVKEEGGDRGWVPVNDSFTNVIISDSHCVQSWFIGKVSTPTGGAPPTPSATHAQNLLASSSMTVDAETPNQPQVSPMSSAFPPHGRSTTVI